VDLLQAAVARQVVQRIEQRYAVAGIEPPLEELLDDQIHR
jgi:hypothetical protein